MKNSKKDNIRRMQVQDALGISRKKKKYIKISWKTYYTVKIILIACIPVLYFLYSPLLLLSVLAYAVVVGFMNKNIELALNENYRKECHVKMPNYDVTVAIITVLIAIIGITAVTVLQKTSSSMLSDMDSDSIEKFKAGKMNIDGGWMQFKQFFTNLGSVLTGEISLFRSLRIGMKAPPDGAGAPQSDFNFSRASISLSDMPLSYIFSTVLAVLCSVLVLGTSLLGGLSFINVKKVQNETKSKRSKHKEYRIKKEKVNVTLKDMEELRQENNILLGIFEDEFSDDDK